MIGCGQLINIIWYNILPCFILTFSCCLFFYLSLPNSSKPLLSLSNIFQQNGYISQSNIHWSMVINQRICYEPREKKWKINRNKWNQMNNFIKSLRVRKRSEVSSPRAYLSPSLRFLLSHKNYQTHIMNPSNLTSPMYLIKHL